MEEMAIFFGSPGEYKVELTVSDGFYSSRSISVVSIIEKELPVIPLREHNFDVEIECVLLNKGDVILKDIECYLKTPQDYFPYQTVNSVIPAAGLAFAGNLFDNNRNLLTHFKYDKGATLGKNEELKAGIINNVTMFEYEFKKISTRQTDYEVGDEDLKKYTSEDLFIDIRDPVIADAVKKAAGNEADPVEKAKSIYDYIASRLHYDFARAEDRQYSFMNASEILKAGKGVCADYAILYVAMLRAAGIPARLATGIPVFLILGQKDQEVDLGHAWVEIKLPGYGWIIVDITQEKGFMKTDFFMNLATEKGSGFLHKSKIMDWSNYYYDGFIYSWEGIDFPDVEQKLIYRIKNLSQSDLYYYQELSRLRILPR